MTALALSGSAAQGKIQRFPADCDFFERVHIRAPTREEACAILARSSATRPWRPCSGPGTGCGRSKWGTTPRTGTVRGRAGRARAAGSRGTPAEVDGRAARSSSGPDGSMRHLPLGGRPGRARLVQARLARRRPRRGASWPTPRTCSTPRGRRPTARSCRSTASWTRTSRRSTSRPTRIPLFSRLVKQLGARRRRRLRGRSSSTRSGSTPSASPTTARPRAGCTTSSGSPGRYAEAAYLRELFDEPVTALYQLAALLRTVDDAAGGQEAFDRETLVAQVDQLIMSAIAALDGPDEAEMVGASCASATSS